MADYAQFRQQLDAALRTQDAKQVQAFLIAQGQWSEDAPADPEYAMWMMIAGTPTLRDLHSRAGEWLVSHGHTNEALAVLGRNQVQGQRRAGQQARTFKKGQAGQKAAGNGHADHKPGAKRAPRRDDKQ